MRIGNFIQHNIHGAFRNGTLQRNLNINKLMKVMYWIFHGSSSKRDLNSQEGSTEVFPLWFNLILYLILQL